MRTTAKCYGELRACLDETSVIDCHDHSAECGPKYDDPIQVVVSGYFPSDVHSVLGDKQMGILQDSSRSLEERWPLLEKAWKRTCHSGYAQVSRLVMKRFYGEEELSLDALKRMGSRLLDLTDRDRFDGILEEAGIVLRIADILFSIPEMQKILEGKKDLAPRSRVAIGLPRYHAIRSYGDVANCTGPMGVNVTSLGEYLEACRGYFERWKAFGAVAFKDQSAYTRTLQYGNPTRAEAEEVFNWFMADPRRSAGYPDASKPLDDYLFHEFMRMARDMELPVQLHTGHMAGIRNDLRKTNAIGLTELLEVHRDVRFDLFHVNWPYSGELLYLGKNYPNVVIDFCWANIIDPIYCQNMMKQALSCMPHGKVFGYGSDFGGSADRAWAHVTIARDNIAIALSEMVEMEYMDLDEAKEVARAWLFDNPNEFFRLGL